MMKDLPDQNALSKLLHCDADAGKLFWLPRDVSMFPAEKYCKIWNTRYAGTEAMTCVSAFGYLHGRIFRKSYFAHRIIWAMANGEAPHGELDHLNGDRSDNRIANLRDVTRSFNQRNVPLKQNNTSGHVGVCWHHGGKKWMARVTTDGKARYLGLFDSIADAVDARNAAQAGLGFTERHGT